MTARFKAIVVDDEKSPREILAEMLAKHFPEIEVLEICSSADEATKAVEKHHPSLVFLDVEMPGKSGFQWIGEMGKVSFEVIFTTSYSKYALEAFRASALDYLLKPLALEDLEEAVKKFKSRSALQDTQRHIEVLLNNIRSPQAETQKIALPTSNGFLFVRISDIVRCMSQNMYVIFFLSDKTQVVVSRTMKECEEMLQPNGFQRIHQSHLINMRCIKRYKKGEGGEVEMDDGTTLEVSRRKKDEFIEAMNKL
jgi:two-component system LytT family response regulator